MSRHSKAEIQQALDEYVVMAADLRIALAARIAHVDRAEKALEEIQNLRQPVRDVYGKPTGKLAIYSTELTKLNIILNRLAQEEPES
jgi:hypothetical protein